MNYDTESFESRSALRSHPHADVGLVCFEGVLTMIEPPATTPDNDGADDKPDMKEAIKDVAIAIIVIVTVIYFVITAVTFFSPEFSALCDSKHDIEMCGYRDYPACDEIRRCEDVTLSDVLKHQKEWLDTTVARLK